MLPFTKQIVLRTSAMFYDLLGVISPLVLQTRVLFTKISIKKINWDDVIHKTFAKELSNLLNSPRNIKHINIDRYVSTISNPDDVLELHPRLPGCISDASQRRLKQRLRDISRRADFEISETSPGRLIRDVSSETSLRSLRLSQRPVASQTVILCLQTKSFFGYLFIYLRVLKNFIKLR